MSETFRKIDALQQTFHEPRPWKDFHAVVTIQFGELLESNWDWGKNEWYASNPEFPVEIRERLNALIEERYYFREICAVPPLKFKKFLIRKLNAIMPKYWELYTLRAAGELNLLRGSTVRHKSRKVFSEYPQSQISGESDYATNAGDDQGITTVDGPVLDRIIKFSAEWVDIDTQIVDALEPCFLALLTTSLPQQN